MRFVREPDADLEVRVAARMQRQAILASEKPPVLVILLDERVIRCPVGGTNAMHDQLLHIAASGERYLIQVVPLAASEALSRRQSIEMIMEASKSWKV